MRQFGLIGKSLAHSFSKTYFEKKFVELGLKDHAYLNFEIQSVEDVKKIISENPDLKGLNVTVPFKETVIPLLNELSAEAKEIGAVNCIKINGNHLVGYNTDAYGFSQDIKPFLDGRQRALILGTGGSAKAVKWSLKKLGLDVLSVTTNAAKKNSDTIIYEEVNEIVMRSFPVIINCTPVGTWPAVERAPSIPYQFFGPQHLAYDLIYNPAETLFLKRAREAGASVVNGLGMLRLQAEKSWQTWNSAG
jgi:shikimate dehydrogenase